ncbi:MAG: FAD:protein FMN transferase [Gemmataceae bacterium]
MKTRSLLLALLLAPAAAADEPKRFVFEEPHMGTKFRIVLYAADQVAANAAAKAAFNRVAELNRIMSDYDSTSELMRLCLANANTAGEPVRVSDELFTVLAQARKVSEKSGGAFDVTVGRLTKLWRLTRKTQKLPDPQELAAARSRVGYKKMELNAKDKTVRLLTPGMQLDLGGIAKGYAADEALAVLKKHGISQALVAAGGDVAVGDAPPGRLGWKIDVAKLTKSSPERALILANAAVSTSGDAEQFALIDGVRYSHIVDPRTGLGQTGRRVVTVVAKQGIVADPMTKAMALLTPEQAMRLIEATDTAAARIVWEQDGREEERESRRWKQYLADW